MKLYGRERTRREVEARVGRLGQIGGVRRVRLCEGPEEGAEQIEVRTGGGLSFWVTPSRGMDIARLEYRGFPLVWMAQGGEPHPAYYDRFGMEWLRTSAGGFLMTCGLRQVGSPCTDEGEELGLHGRIHHTPARQIRADGQWVSGHHFLQVAGEVRESRVFGENLVLYRIIEAELGSNTLRITDRVENEGFEPSPLMLLYHFNFGFPLLQPSTALHFPSRHVEPRDSGTPLEGYDRWSDPVAGAGERVYYHSGLVTECDEMGRDWATARIISPDFPSGPIEAVLSWDAAMLPGLVQWKMPGEGNHVLGIEPANCRVGGRAAERQRGTLEMIGPGESRVYHLTFSVVE